MIPNDETAEPFYQISRFAYATDCTSFSKVDESKRKLENYKKNSVLHDILLYLGCWYKVMQFGQKAQYMNYTCTLLKGRCYASSLIIEYAY